MVTEPRLPGATTTQLCALRAVTSAARGHLIFYAFFMSFLDQVPEHGCVVLVLERIRAANFSAMNEVMQ
jgi:hypothetical protein